MDNPHWIAGRIGGFRFGRIYRMAQAEADAVFGRAWVTCAVVSIAVVWTSAVLTEASKPEHPNQTSHIHQTIDPFLKEAMLIHEQATQKREGYSRDTVSLQGT